MISSLSSLCLLQHSCLYRISLRPQMKTKTNDRCLQYQQRLWNFQSEIFLPVCIKSIYLFSARNRGREICVYVLLYIARIFFHTREVNGKPPSFLKKKLVCVVLNSNSSRAPSRVSNSTGCEVSALDGFASTSIWSAGDSIMCLVSLAWNLIRLKVTENKFQNNLILHCRIQETLGNGVRVWHSTLKRRTPNVAESKSKSHAASTLLNPWCPSRCHGAVTLLS